MDPGSACGMPYAPELGFSAYTFQPLSCPHSASRQENCPDHPYRTSICSAICCGAPEASRVTAASVAACSAAACRAARRTAARSAAALAAAPGCRTSCRRAPRRGAGHRCRVHDRGPVYRPDENGLPGEIVPRCLPGGPGRLGAGKGMKGEHVGGLARRRGRRCRPRDGGGGRGCREAEHPGGGKHGDLARKTGRTQPWQLACQRVPSIGRGCMLRPRACLHPLPAGAPFLAMSHSGKTPRLGCGLGTGQGTWSPLW